MPPTRIAEFVSAATRLPLLAVPLFLAVGVRSAGVAGLSWALLCLFLTSGLSLLYLAHLVRSGRVRDAGKIPQSERVGPLRVVAGLHVAAFLVVMLLDVPAALRAVLLSYAVATTLFALISPRVNLSLHTAGVSGAAVCLLFVFGAWASPSILLVPLVWWARTILKRHTPAELALGVLVGGGGTLVSFLLIA